MQTAHSTPPRSSARRHRVTVWITLFAVPLIWLFHLVLCISLVSSACAGGVAQRGEMSWNDIANTIDATSAVAFTVCVVLALATGRAWRRIVWSAHGESDATCIIAWCSVTVAVIFTGALAFTACVLIAAPFDRLCAPFQ